MTVKTKKARLQSSLKYTRSNCVKVRLQWKRGAKKTVAEATLLLDSGASGPVLSSRWVKRTQMPCVRHKGALPISDMSGNYIPRGLHYTKEVKMCIRDHVNSMRFELAEMQDTKIDAHLPMSWLKDHNSDIDWGKGILTW